jgi:glycine/D-amino acid oxidase-like deaminating enzyme
MLLNHSGYVDVKRWLGSAREALIDAGSYKDEPFVFDRLNVADSTIQYEGVEASAIIFCEGIHATKNPYFSWLPLKPLKGEVLEVELSERLKMIFNRGVYVVPAGQSLFCVGATYENQNLSEEVTDAARAGLEERLRELIKIPYQVINQNWGIRPVVVDRKPLLGGHPDHKNVIIFNGLGTKGVSLAPYYATQLAKWLNEEVELDTEVNITRFKSLYSKF